MRVSLITTGIMEFRGLSAALQKIFPSHEFHMEPDTPGKPFHGFTSARVRLLSPNDPPGGAGRMLRAALGTVVPPDATTPASDLACILEDLEIVNKANEAVLIEHLRESARRVISMVGPAGDPAKVANALREKVSFHLAVPMPESWFFGDLAALKTEVPEPTEVITTDASKTLTNATAHGGRWKELADLRLAPAVVLFANVEAQLRAAEDAHAPNAATISALNVQADRLT
jgi:hypothetical protein